jgi:hypothetical protein
MIASVTGHWLISYLQPIETLLSALKGLDEWITLVLVLLIASCIYRSARNSGSIAEEMDALSRRYLLFRNEKQIALKMHEQNEEVRNEILRSISNSWKYFRRTHGELVGTLLGTIRKTLVAYYVILGISVINTVRVFLTDWFTSGGVPSPLEVAIKEGPSYLLLALGFLLIRMQTHRKRGGRGRPYEIELETLFPEMGVRDRSIYDEFEPMDDREGGGVGKIEEAGNVEEVSGVRRRADE